jgi:23S rRNA (cytidine1920-2'-O)/16S rRNA (cytidine1409-2'-O)-methyltransferase
VRLDEALVKKGFFTTRSQAENYIKLGKVKLDGKVIYKAGYQFRPDCVIEVDKERYVSRAGLKLASVAGVLKLDFRDKVVLDVGSSTGGFTDYVLKHGAKKVIAVDVGSQQLHPSLRLNPKIELHEQTDIRQMINLTEAADIVLIDVSFISLRQILPAVAKLAPEAEIIAMVKPQFEAGSGDVHSGVLKNDTLRRRVLKDFEGWVKKQFIVKAKADSEVSGAKGNLERFYVLKTAI